MPSAAARRARSSGGAAPKGARKRGKGVAAKSQPLEQRILITATLCLLGFGAVMVYSASSATSLLQSGGTGSGYLVKYLIYGAIGLFVMRVLARDGVEKVQSFTGPLLAASFVLVLAVHVPHVGVSVNGARRWIGPGPFQFQPSELMKLALVLYSATLLAKRPSRVHDLKDLLKPLLLVVGAAILLVVTQPDLGTAMVIAFTTIALLIAAGIEMRRLAIIVGSAFALVVLYALVKPYARARLTSFLDPWAHASSSGFQAVQGQIAIGSGGLFGVGPGQSVQKIFYLPEAPTDFILAVIAEELGAVGVCALLFLYGLIAYAGLRAAKGARSLHSALIAVGVTSLIVSQALLNVFAVLGLAPLTGVPLPFVSYGSSSLIVMLAAMGLLVNVASGGTAHVRAVSTPRRRSADASARETARWGDESNEADRDRRRRDGGARRAGARGSGRAAG
ncbi:MAG TPA: putative lipid II flippase FtsW [Solirubrobacteraceae bacterium]|jgi:cell division protein FtsW|nr:putative lipid II flippase FtsW [Solirubrobacteraceae bacterium]